LPEQREIDEGEWRPLLAANEQREQEHARERAAEKERRRHAPRISFVEHGNERGERRRDQDRAFPVEARILGQVLGGR
jgi:hypothetical protein